MVETNPRSRSSFSVRKSDAQAGFIDQNGTLSSIFQYCRRSS